MVRLRIELLMDAKNAKDAKDAKDAKNDALSLHSLPCMLLPSQLGP